MFYIELLMDHIFRFSRFATLSGVNNDESSDEEEGQAFYAGGSERRLSVKDDV